MPIDDKFMNELEKKYMEVLRDKSIWDSEKDKLKRFLIEIEKLIENRYYFEAPINVGGIGVISKVIDKNLEIPFALKCARPMKDKEPLLNKIISSEISHLKAISHQNVITIFFKDEVNVDGKEWPFFIMEFIEDPIDGFKYIKNNKPNYDMLLNFFIQWTKGLKYFHSRNTIHGDVKLENILISSSGTLKISDLGSARLLSPGDQNTTTIAFDKNYAHPKLRELIYNPHETDPNRFRGEIKRSELKEIFDIYALGKNLIRVLKMYDVTEYDILPNYYRQYFHLMATRMLDGLNYTEDEKALGLETEIYNQICYKDINEILIDLKKLQGGFDLYKEIPELNENYPRTIQISSHTKAPLTQRIINLLKSPLVRKLAGVSQLNLVTQVYPTATHTRFEHTLGAMYNVARYCISLWNDPINPFFRQIMNTKELNLVLITAIIHDIGHYPLAHTFEEVDNKIFSHHGIAEQLLNDKKNKYSLELIQIIKNDWGIEKEEIIELFKLDINETTAPIKLKILHTLFDGPIDADRVDYLIRDSEHLKLTYGNIIDFDRLLKCLTIIFEKGILGIHEKGKIPAESIAFARYAMYGTVYWQHTIRSARSMVIRALWEALEKEGYKKIKKEFYNAILKIPNLFESIEEKEPIQLFPDKEIGDTIQITSVKNYFIEALQLSFTDYQMLLWVYEKTNEYGKDLIKMVINRNSFKRLLVISERQNPNLWDELNDLIRNYNWDVKLMFQRMVQKELVEALSSLDDSKRTTTVMQREKTDVIFSRSNRGEILFIVDLPFQRQKNDELFFLTEARIHGPLGYVSDRVKLEDSILWTQLTGNNFIKYIGKVRIFCHPDIIETCMSCLSVKLIEKILKNVCKSAKAKS